MSDEIKLESFSIGTTHQGQKRNRRKAKKATPVATQAKSKWATRNPQIYGTDANQDATSEVAVEPKSPNHSKDGADSVSPQVKPETMEDNRMVDRESDNYRDRNDGSRDNYRDRNDGSRDNYRDRNDGYRDNYRDRNDGSRDNYRDRNDGYRDNYRDRNDGYRDRNDGYRDNYRDRDNFRSRDNYRGRNNYRNQGGGRDRNHNRMQAPERQAVQHALSYVSDTDDIALSNIGSGMQNFDMNDLTQISFDSYRCNINREGDDINLLYLFDDILPKYDTELGPYLALRESNGLQVVKRISLWNDSDVCVVHNFNENKLYNDLKSYQQRFVEIKSQFLQQHVIQGLHNLGLEKPSAVQSLSILDIIMGRDVIVNFKPGTGKTISFAGGCLWHFDPHNPELQHIFITCNHQVAGQIYCVIRKLLPATARVALCTGQKPSRPDECQRVSTSNHDLPLPDETPAQQRKSCASAQVIIGTTGRIMHFFSEGYIKFGDSLKTFCLDEFDLLLTHSSEHESRSDFGTTQQQITQLIQGIPAARRPHVQMIFFAATVNPQAITVAKSYFRPENSAVGAPLVVLLNADDSTLQSITQYYMNCQRINDKFSALRNIFSNCIIQQAIIFVNEIRVLHRVVAALRQNKIVEFDVGIIHADLSEAERRTIYNNLVGQKIKLVVATDVISRGVDAQGINMVINFDLPSGDNFLSTYINRCGRSGRFGRKGVVISLVTATNDAGTDERFKIDIINKASVDNAMRRLDGSAADFEKIRK